jgi:hypothetical protein
MLSSLRYMGGTLGMQLAMGMGGMGMGREDPHAPMGMGDKSIRFGKSPSELDCNT